MDVCMEVRETYLFPNIPGHFFGGHLIESLPIARLRRNRKPMRLDAGHCGFVGQGLRGDIGRSVGPSATVRLGSVGAQGQVCFCPNERTSSADP